ncbi:MAG: imidazole glycerol phosphate synthase subunit HisH [Acidiferrobacteraceae bacterium]
MSTIAVVDYGMGNLRSVCQALAHVAPTATVQLASTAGALKRADRVVFPGQGAIGGCMKALSEGQLGEALLDAAARKPFLGICLGLQALYDFSDEGGGVKGLGLLRGRVPRFTPQPGTGARLKIPHMGWNQVHQVRAHPLWRGIDQDSRFYFVHSYYARPDDPGEICGVTEYGISFASAAGRDNLFAVQFHPEKSHVAGLILLENFCRWDGTSG